MRVVERHVITEDLARVRPERREALRAWLDREIEDALASRAQQDAVWREALRLYEGVAKNPARNFPVENAPNTEVTLGAIAVDSLYAQILDLIYNISPLVTTRAITPDAVQAAKALQTFINWGVTNEWNLRPASEHTILDDVQLGTGVYYVPFVEMKKKTRLARWMARGPRIVSVPLEDFVLPAGAGGDLQLEPWVAVRTWYTEGEFADQATAGDWTRDVAQPVGQVGWVRSQRERLGHSVGTKVWSALYEIYRVWCYFDLDDDGTDEDLLVVYDRTSRQVLSLRYSPYERRPLEAMRYQLRAHLFYGMGVMDMIKPYQEEATEVHNARVLNMLLANARFWKAKHGSVPETMRVWPGKVQMMQEPADLDPVQMADVYPSSGQAEAIVISLAERRVGVNDMSLPRPSQVLGSRTPGITTLSMLQQVNRRFTPAFDGVRFATAAAIRQCLYRYQERLLSSDMEAEAHILRVLGPEQGALVVDLLKDDAFDEAVAVELQASSAVTNRDAERQNALLLVNILTQYYQRTLELVAIAANPQTPEPVREVARKIAEAAGEMIDRTIRAFDQVRDPETFIIRMDEQLDAIDGLNAEGMLGLQQMLQSVSTQIASGQPPVPLNGAGV